MIYHVILRSYKASATPEQIEESQDRIRRFTSIEGVESAITGPNLGLVPFHDGLTHATILAVKDADALKAFIADPFHQESAALSRVITERSIIVDIEAP
jgi:Stress responsive A/B Barrel Domain